MNSVVVLFVYNRRRLPSREIIEKNEWIELEYFDLISIEPLASLPEKMIHWILVFSRLGKIRLRRHWKTVPLAEKVKIASDVMNLVLPRAKSASNFIEWKDQRLVYRRYASLYFCICMENNQNEHGILEITL